MDNQSKIESKKPVNQPRSNTTPIRVLKATAKKIKGVIQKLNKKPLGRKIRIDDVLVKALSLLKENHLEEIIETTLSNADKLERQYRHYCKQYGPISKDEYVGKLLNAGLPSLGDSPL